MCVFAMTYWLSMALSTLVWVAGELLVDLLPASGPDVSLRLGLEDLPIDLPPNIGQGQPPSHPTCQQVLRLASCLYLLKHCWVCSFSSLGVRCSAKWKPQGQWVVFAREHPLDVAFADRLCAPSVESWRKSWSWLPGVLMNLWQRVVLAQECVLLQVDGHWLSTFSVCLT